eukprot:1161082-Pelagomonas_calceolata.AAC.5
MKLTSTQINSEGRSEKKRLCQPNGCVQQGKVPTLHASKENFGGQLSNQESPQYPTPNEARHRCSE